MMRHTERIGRAGALAVALGIGAGLAATPWVAAAEASSGTDSSSTRLLIEALNSLDLSWPPDDFDAEVRRQVVQAVIEEEKAPAGPNVSVSVNGETKVQKGTATASS